MLLLHVRQPRSQHPSLLVKAPPAESAAPYQNELGRPSRSALCLIHPGVRPDLHACHDELHTPCPSTSIHLSRSYCCCYSLQPHLFRRVIVSTIALNLCLGQGVVLTCGPLRYLGTIERTFIERPRSTIATASILSYPATPPTASA